MTYAFVSEILHDVLETTETPVASVDRRLYAVDAVIVKIAVG